MILESQKRYKVLFLPKWYPSRQDVQLGVFVKNHARAASGIADVSVLYVTGDVTQKVKFNIDVRQGEVNECIVTYKQCTSLFKSLINFFRYIRASLIGYPRLVQLSGKPDIVHVHVMNRPALLAMYLYVFYRIPFIVTEHWTGYLSGHYEQWSFLKRRFHYWVLKKSSAITVVSESLQKKINSIVPGKEVTIIPNVLDFEVNKKQKKEIGVPVMLTVADLVDQKKNISAVIRVLVQLAAEGKEFIYHIIGGGEDEEMLKQLAGNQSLNNAQIIFHGRQSNDYVINFLPTIDFLIVNSNVETFCVVAAEALKVGKPVIVTRSGGPETFVTKDCGIVIEPKSDDELRSAILLMREGYKQYDPEMLSAYIDSKFGPEKVSAMFEELYSIVKK